MKKVHKCAAPRDSNRLVQSVWAILNVSTWLALSGAIYGQTVTCDFAEEQAVGPMNGILEGWSDMAPSDALIRGVVNEGDFARIFAHEPGNIARALGLGCRVVVRLDGYRRETGKWPYEDWTAWEAWCADLAETWGNLVIYDVWNEPNLDDYWAGSEAQYHEAYKRAHGAILATAPSAKLSGPSRSSWSSAAMVRFLNYCVANSLKCHYLQWHEFTNDPRTVEDNLNHARTNWQENAAYSSVGIEALLIGESVSRTKVYLPGFRLGFFYYMEKGGAAGACNSCWNAASGHICDDCEVQSLSGLMTPDKRLRTNYYVFNDYKKGVAYRVAGGTDDERVVALPSRRLDFSADRAQVLVGYFRLQTADPASLNVTVNLQNLHSLPFLAGKSQFALRVEKLRTYGTGADPSNGHELVSQSVEPIESGGRTITLTGVGIEEAWKLTILPPEGDASHTIDASAQGGGSIAPSGDVTVYPGDIRGFSVEPDAGYEIESVVVDGKDAGPFPSYVFDGIAGGHTIVARFSTPPPGVGAWWRFRSGLEGWTARHDVSAFTWQAGSFADVEVSGADPYLWSPDAVGADLAAHRFVRVRMRNNSAATTAQIFFTTTTDSTWNGAKSKNFPIQPHDTNYRTYAIDMSGVAGWTGTLKQLRLDPTTVVNSGTVSIDSIMVTDGAPELPGTYEAWRLEQPWENPGDDLPGADPNHDGIENLLCFASDIAPLASGRATPIAESGTTSEGGFYLVFRQPPGGAIGVEYSVWSSVSLEAGSWSRLDFSPGTGNTWQVLPGDPDGDGSAQLVRVEVPPPASDRFFVVLRVELQE